MNRKYWLLFGMMFMLAVFFQGAAQAAAELAATQPAATAKQGESAEDLAKQSQNPVSNLMSVPFQYNVYSGGALGNSTMSVLNIQPVIPKKLNKDWNLITRIIFPLISSPSPTGTVSGTGDTNASFFFSPNKPGNVTMGFGPIVQIPTASSDILGTQTWGIGPTAVIVKTYKQWVIGAMANYITTVGNSPTGRRTDQMLVQPFFNYNFPHAKGFSMSYAPQITADFTRAPGDQWTLPVGLMATQIFRIGKQPVSFSLGGFKNVIRPSNAPEWNIRFVLTFMFPE